MSNMTVKFLGKEYSIPEDVLVYLDLLKFTDSIKNVLMTAFNRKLSNSDIGCIEDKDMATEINQQVSKFISMLCDKGIYDITANDYLRNNKGYELFSQTNKAAFEKAKAILMNKLDTLKYGVEDALYKKDASVTGMGFSIWSGSFVNHAIYAAMQASTIRDQEKAANVQYQKDMDNLFAKMDSDEAKAKREYIYNVYIPNIDVALTVFAYELLDKYISDLIANNKFDKHALDFIDIARSNELLDNLTLSNNKSAILENAFVACPYNMAVYMHAMKLEMLDVDTFETANIFKQGSKIISFLKESLGAADYPNFVEPNYYSASLLARYENKSRNDVLYQHTSSYANAVIREYGKIVRAFDSPNQCRDYLRKLNDDAILSEEGTSKRLAKSLVYSIAPNDNWNILVKQCGHADLLERLLAIMPAGSTFGSKEDCDSYLTEALFNALEVARKDLAQRILESRACAAAERQKLEVQKRKKRIKTTAILCAIFAVIIVAISLPSIIENAKISKRERYVEEQIQAVIVPLEKEM